MTTTNNAVETVTINVFKDNEGDYVVTTAPMVAAGITAFQLNGPAVDAVGGPLAVLNSLPDICLLLSTSELQDDAMATIADAVARLEHKLVEAVECPTTDKVVAALTQEAA